MRTQFLAMILSAALPLAAHAQGGPQPGAGPQGAGPGANAGPGHRMDPQRMEKRMRLARTLGLAEALDLDESAALKLGQTMSKFDERRVAVRKQLQESRQVLVRAAQGEKVTAGEVDQAIAKSLDGRAQLLTINRELVAAVTKDLTPERKARAVIFLAKFQRRFAGPPGMGPGMMMGPGGQNGGPGMRHGGHGGGMGGGMGPGGGMGMGGSEWGMAPGGEELGPIGMAPPPPPDELDDE
ncbi:MAG TPA: hypothetical protein VF875_09265 [Anaeromyxobacter sp.]